MGNSFFSAIQHDKALASATIAILTISLNYCDQTWQNLATLSKKIKCLATIEGLFSIHHGLKPTLANVKYYCANFPSCKWSNIGHII